MRAGKGQSESCRLVLGARVEAAKHGFRLRV